MRMQLGGYSLQLECSYITIDHWIAQVGQTGRAHTVAQLCRWTLLGGKVRQ